MIGEFFKSTSKFRCGDSTFIKGVKYYLSRKVIEDEFTLYMFSDDSIFCEYNMEGDLSDRFIDRFISLHEERVRVVNEILYG